MIKACACGAKARKPRRRKASTHSSHGDALILAHEELHRSIEAAERDGGGLSPVQREVQRELQARKGGPGAARAALTRSSSPAEQYAEREQLSSSSDSETDSSDETSHGTSDEDGSDENEATAAFKRQLSARNIDPGTIFTAFDQDGTGVISVDDFKDGMARLDAAGCASFRAPRATSKTGAYASPCLRMRPPPALLSGLKCSWLCN